METKINLSYDECNYLLNVLKYFEKENLRKSLCTIQSIKYEKVKGFYADKESFENDMDYKENIISQQIKMINNIYEKIEKRMEE